MNTQQGMIDVLLYSPSRVMSAINVDVNERLIVIKFSNFRNHVKGPHFKEDKSTQYFGKLLHLIGETPQDNWGKVPGG